MAYHVSHHTVRGRAEDSTASHCCVGYEASDRRRGPRTVKWPAKRSRSWFSLETDAASERVLLDATGLSPLRPAPASDEIPGEVHETRPARLPKHTRCEVVPPREVLDRVGVPSLH